VVDFSAGMVEQAKRKGLRGLHMDAESFSALSDQSYSKGLLKETVHHVKDRVAFFSGVARQLQPGGVFAVLTRPPRPQFPFFEAALDVFEAGQEHEDVFKREMLSGGFKQVMLCRVPCY
jgi:ubiquinone/menaquinone biosynthesis C-methylase UbiE